MHTHLHVCMAHTCTQPHGCCAPPLHGGNAKEGWRGCFAFPAPAEPQAHMKWPSAVAMVTRAGEKRVVSILQLREGQERSTARLWGKGKARFHPSVAPEALGKGKGRRETHCMCDNLHPSSLRYPSQRGCVIFPGNVPQRLILLFPPPGVLSPPHSLYQTPIHSAISSSNNTPQDSASTGPGKCTFRGLAFSHQEGPSRVFCVEQ